MTLPLSFHRPVLRIDSDAGDPIRDLAGASVRVFMEQHQQYLSGRVLDFGAGRQPYRDLVDGEYIPVEKGRPSPDTADCIDTVMCNQVMQYVREPFQTLHAFAYWLKIGGHLVMTYPTCWQDEGRGDLWRFTKAGMGCLLDEAGFSVVLQELLAEVEIGTFKFPLGYGVIARR
jgi:hypothetical protein